MKNNSIRVLQVLVGGKAFTGISSYLYQYYRNIDTTKVHFDFLFCRENSMESKMMDPIFKESRFFQLNAFRKKTNSTDYKAVYKGVKEILDENKYDVVVVNTSVAVVLTACVLAASKCDNLCIITHAHNTDLIIKNNCIRQKLKPIVQIFDNICRMIIRKKSDYFFACTNDAAVSTFGKDILYDKRLRIINNAIDIKKFLYNEETRKRLRKQFNVKKDMYIYGNVGKLSYRKNQRFLLEIFANIQKKQPNSELWIVGEGEDRLELEDLVKQLHLVDKVRFLGQRNDINDILQAMDCFVFTTLSEGLGIVAIEAQAAGLFTIISNGVPSSANISELCYQISLEKGADVWASEILNFCSSKTKRESMQEVLVHAGYDIQVEAEKMTDFFLKLNNNTY